MALPPSDVAPSELVLKLMESPRPSEVINFPRKDKHGIPIGKVRVQILRMDEHDRARSMAHAKLKSRKFSNEDMANVAIREVYGDAVAKELLAMACLTDKPAIEGDPPIYGRIFRDAEEISTQLSADEVLVLFNAYQLVQNKYGPFERTVTTNDEVDAWVKRLGEGASELPLLHLALPQLVDLSSSLAARTYGLYAILASQWSSLPDTLVASLENYSTAITSCGVPAAESGSIGGVSNLDQDITLEDALRFAEHMRG